MTIAVRHQLFQQAVTNTIGGTAFDAPQIGYLDANKTQLEVQTTITQADNNAYFKFAFRKGTKLNLNTNINKGVRVQLLDASGNKVIADSAGTNSAAKKAFADLQGVGKELKNTSYVIKISYDGTTSKSKALNASVTLSSGTAYESKYKTLASADTIENLLLNGGSIGAANTGSITASLLTDSSSGTATNIIDYLA